MRRTSLKGFIAAVGNGSFTAATNVLDVSTSFVRRQVARMMASGYFAGCFVVPTLV
jgi:DNA-binding transcriptional LysR family regulator